MDSWQTMSLEWSRELATITLAGGVFCRHVRVEMRKMREMLQLAARVFCRLVFSCVPSPTKKGFLHARSRRGDGEFTPDFKTLTRSQVFAVFRAFRAKKPRRRTVTCQCLSLGLPPDPSLLPPTPLMTTFTRLPSFIYVPAYGRT